MAVDAPAHRRELRRRAAYAMDDKRNPPCAEITSRAREKTSFRTVRATAHVRPMVAFSGPVNHADESREDPVFIGEIGHGPIVGAQEDRKAPTVGNVLRHAIFIIFIVKSRF